MASLYRVLVYGTVLLTAYADRLGDASGPLMIAYALVMLVNQALLGTGMLDAGAGMAADGMSTTDGMEATGTMGGRGITAGMGWDAGMVALAVLMLASGVIMTRGGGEAGDDGM